MRRFVSMVAGGPLIGRESELAALEGLLASTRLLTVTGAGGCGKTRLALELADRLVSKPEGPACAVAALANVVSEEQLVGALLAAVGARERFGRRPRQVLCERAASRRLLLVFDNCEHLTAVLGGLTVELLGAAAGVTVLATSREPLGVPLEQVFRLGPLSLPDAEAEEGDIGAIVRSDAGRLFVERAVKSAPAFELTPASAGAVARICLELDGLPLALCLAAARLDTLSVHEIAQGLSRRGRLAAAIGEDELSQHSSMRASLDWSYRLLDRRQQRLLRRLSIFSGGFTGAAAHAVAFPETSEADVRDQLGVLEAKGLLVPGVVGGRKGAAGAEKRWAFLQTVGEYAAEQLASTGECERIADRHLAWFEAYAARAGTMLLAGDGHELIDEERANLRLALDRAIACDPRGALQIAASLMRHWVLAEHFQEARSICAAVLSAMDGCAILDGEEDGDADAVARAVVHCGGGLIDLLSEDYAQAIESTQTGLALLAGMSGHAGARADCLLFSSMVLIQTGLDLQEGMRNAELAVELQRGAGDPLGLAFALVSLAIAAGLCDRFDPADAAYREFLAIPPACEHARLRTWAEQAAAWAELSIGSPRRALEHTDSAIALEGDWPSMTHFQAVGFRIQALARLGRTDQALREGLDTMRRAQDSGALQAVPAIELALALAELMHGDLDAADERARRLLQMPHLHTLALVREIQARAALIRGDAEAAHAHACELEAIAQRSGSPRCRALADYIAGSAAVHAGEVDRGRDRLHAALKTCAELGLEREAADALDELALLAAEGGEDGRAARLAAAAAQARTRLDCIPTPAPATYERLRSACSRSIGGGDDDGDGVSAGDCDRASGGDAARWEEAWAQGESIALADAIAYARRGRGPRGGRPTTGWGSLTPAESDVARLAASGVSNPKIAARLFMARGTVKMHLSNVYRKLGVANRTELAAGIATRLSDPDPRPSGDRDRQAHTVS
jgi:predicted ATPase/DNA-binding CsgD family transcriptional regulator